MCTGTGWPLPFITVTRGESLMNHPRFSYIIIPEDAFTISVMMNMTDAEVGDTGDYACKGTSTESQDQQFFFIGVLGTNIELIGIINSHFHSSQMLHPSSLFPQMTPF